MKSARQILLSLVHATQSLTQRVIGRRGIRVREPLAYVLAFALVVVTVGVFLRFHIAGTYQEEMAYWRARQASVADDRAHWISDWLTERQADAELISSFPLVRAALRVHYDAGQPWGRPAVRLPELTAVLDEMAGLYSYSGVYVLDREARVVAQSNYATPLSPLLAETCRDAARTNGRRIDLLGGAPDRSLISFSVPVFPESAPTATGRPPAQPLGIALVVVEAARTIFPLLTREGVLTQTGETLLVRREGDEVIFFSPLRHIPAGSPNLRFPLSTAPLPARRAVEGLATFEEYNEYWGAPVLATTRYIPLTEWGIVQKINRAEALHDFYRMAIVEGLAAGLLIILLGGLLLFYRRDVLTRVLKREEAKFRALLESAPDAMVIADGEGRVVLLNAQAETMFGFRREELIGLGLRMLFPEWAHVQHGESLPWDFSTEVAQQVGKTMEMRGLRKDGTKFPLEARLGRIETAEGPAFSCAIRDITERKRAQEALQTSEEQFRQMFSNMSSGMAVYEAVDEGADFVIKEFNPAAERATKLKRAEALGRRISEAFPDVAHFGWLEVLQRVRRTGTPERQPAGLYQDERLTMWAENYVFKLPSGDIVAIFDDITERKCAEEALRESEARYRRLFEQNLAGVFRGTLDGHVLDCNNAYARMLGYNSPQEILDLEKLDYFYDAQEGMATLARLRREGLHANLELRLKRRDGSSISVLSNVTLTEMGESRLLLVEGTLIDITMRKCAEEARAFLASLVESSQDAIIGTTLEALTVSWNHGAEELYGYSAKEMVGNYVSILYPPDHLDEFAPLVEKVRQGKRINRYESVRVRKDGTRVDVSLTFSPVYDTTGRITGTVAIARDITERKRAEAEMAERHRLETLVAEVGVALTGAESLRQGLQQCAEILVRNINAALARIWTVNEADKVLELQASAGMYTHLDGGHARVPLGQFKIGRIAENGEPHLTNTVQQDSGVRDPEWARREGMVAFAGYPLRVGEHVLGVAAAFARQPLTPATLQAFASVAHNLAQFIKRKRAEEALRESEEKYRALIETTGTGYVITDMQGRVIDANPEYVRLTGHQALQGILGRRVTEWTAQHDLARTAEAVRRCAELGFVRNLEIEHVNGDGKCTPIELNATVVPAAGGVRIVGLCRDITDRKRAEQALRESEERYRLLFERNLAGVFRGTLLSQRILDCNVAYARILGYDSRQEARSRGKLRDFYEPGEFETAKARLLNEKVLTNFEVRLRRKDQTPVWVLANVSLIEAGEAEEPLVAGTLIDITERKQAEQALAQERDLLGTLMDNLPDYIYFKDRQSRFLRANRAHAKAFRLSDPGQAVGKTDFDFFTAEHAQQAYNDEQEVITTGKPMTAKEEKETWPDGRVTWVSTTKMPFRDANGAIIGTFGVSRDITARKRTEKALEERTTYLNTLIDISPLGIVVLDTEDRVQMSNPAFEKLFFYSRREMQGVNLDELIIPRELVSEAESLTRQCLGGASVHATSRRRRKDGTLVELEIYAVPLVMEGKPRGVLALYQDITERKCAEEALRASEERYRELFENASDLVYTTDLEGCLTSLNRVAEQTLAYSREEAAQMNLRQLVDPRHWRRVEQTRERLLAGDSAVTLELEITAKDGRRVMLEVNPRLIYKDGKPAGMQGIGRDITGRDEREMELRHAQKLESVGRLASGIAHEINTPIQFVGDNTRFVQDSFGGLQTLLSKYQELRDAAAYGTVSPDLLAAVRRVEEESDCAYSLEEIPKALAQTLDGVTRVATLVRAMKDFAHPESKEKAAADLNKALLSTLTVARNELKYVADVETDLGDLPLVVCNISDLNQVFLNLLVNAAHAISEVVKGSGEKGKIRVRTVAEDNTVLVTITDTGCGIPEGIRTKVFDPFFTTKEVGRGTGQGLAIARSVVVERHKGTLTFESEVGKGTTFYICLPLEPGECSREMKVQ